MSIYTNKNILRIIKSLAEVEKNRGKSIFYFLQSDSFIRLSGIAKLLGYNRDDIIRVVNDVYK